MSVKKVPVSINVNGTRQVIGEAVVEIDGEYWSIDAKVNMEFAPYLEDDVQYFSLGPFTAPTKKGQ